MRRIFFFTLSSIVVCGCTTLTHVDQLLTLQAVGTSHAEQKKYVHEHTEYFEKILKAYRDGKLTDYPDMQSIEKNFGDPIYVKEDTKDGQKYTKWAYRHPLKAFETERLYLYFDSNGKLLRYEYVEKPPPKIKPETSQSPDAPAPTPTTP